MEDNQHALESNINNQKTKDANHLSFLKPVSAGISTYDQGLCMQYAFQCLENQRTLLPGEEENQV